MTATVGQSQAGAPVVQRAKRSLPVVALLQAQILLWTVLPSKFIFGPLGGVGAPNRVLGLVLLAVWAVSVLTPSLGVVRKCNPVRVALLLYALAALLSLLVMNFHMMPPKELSGSSMWMIGLASFAGVALAAAEGIPGRAELKRLVRTAVYGIAFMSLTAVLQARAKVDLTTWFAKLPLLHEQTTYSAVENRVGLARPAGTALHPIEFGVVVGMGLALAIWMAVYDTETVRWKRYGALGVIAIGVPTAISRSALLVTVIVMIFFLVGATPVLRAKGLAATAAVTTVMFVTVPGLIGTLSNFITAGSSDSSIASRTDDYSVVAPLLRNSPWIGRGPGTFISPDHPILDNYYLLTLVELGIIGLVAILVVLVTPAALGRGARRRDRDEGDRFLGQMFAGAAVGGAVATVTFDSMSFPSFFFAAALLLGLSGAWWGMARAETGELDDPERRRILGGRLVRPWADQIVPVPVVIPVPATHQPAQPTLVGRG